MTFSTSLASRPTFTLIASLNLLPSGNLLHFELLILLHLIQCLLQSFIPLSFQDQRPLRLLPPTPLLPRPLPPPTRQLPLEEKEIMGNQDILEMEEEGEEERKEEEKKITAEKKRIER